MIQHTQVKKGLRGAGMMDQMLRIQFSESTKSIAPCSSCSRETDLILEYVGACIDSGSKTVVLNMNHKPQG